MRGIRFFDRADVRGAIDLVKRAAPTATGLSLIAEIRTLWATQLGYSDDAVAGNAGDEARERTAALDTLLDILSAQVRGDSGDRRHGLPGRARAAAQGRARRARPRA